MGSHLVTVILPTYNRKHLLIRAYESCMNQTNRDFDLIIVDNCSTDGTREFLGSIDQSGVATRVIYNTANLGPRESVLRAFSAARTEWVTILSDDDYLDDRFIERSVGVLEATEADLVVVGYRVATLDGQILSVIRPPACWLPPAAALVEGLEGRVVTAGVSGFFVRLAAATAQPIPEYPKGFLEDTMLCFKAAVRNGVELIDEVLYTRSIWEGSESSFSVENSKMYLKALVLFSEDLRKLVREHQLPPPVLSVVDGVQPVSHFARIILVPTIARGAVGSADIVDVLRLLLAADARYWPHCLLYAVVGVVSCRWTLGIRRAGWTALRWLLHRLRRRLA